jgi:hypothetical protein
MKRSPSTFVGQGSPDLASETITWILIIFIPGPKGSLLLKLNESLSFWEVQVLPNTFWNQASADFPSETVSWIVIILVSASKRVPAFEVER